MAYSNGVAAIARAANPVSTLEGRLKMFAVLGHIGGLLVHVPDHVHDAVRRFKCRYLSKAEMSRVRRKQSASSHDPKMGAFFQRFDTLLRNASRSNGAIAGPSQYPPSFPSYLSWLHSQQRVSSRAALTPVESSVAAMRRVQAPYR